MAPKTKLLLGSAALLVVAGAVAWVASTSRPWAQHASPSTTHSATPAPPLRPQRLTDEPVVSAEDATRARNDELVLGVIVDGAAKAYPIRAIQMSREHGNDRVAEVPLCVSWCPLTRSASAFRRRVSEKVLTFAFNSETYQNNLLLYDTQTRSVWSQLARRAIDGPMKGEELTLLPAVQTTWEHWRDLRPETTVIQTERGKPVEYRPEVVEEIRRARETGTAPSLTARSLVLGTVIGDVPTAYPLSELAAGAVPVRRTIDGRTVSVHLDMRAPAAWVEADDRSVLPVITAFHGAWTRFYPDTRIFRRDNDRS